MPRGDNAGHPFYKPTAADRNTVKFMSVAGIPQEIIADCIGTEGIDPKTLRFHFKREIAIAKAAIIGKAVGKLYEAIDNGAPWAICFMLKCRGGWHEKSSVEVSGPNNGPVQLQAMRDAMMGAVADMDPTVKIQIAERLMITDGSED